MKLQRSNSTCASSSPWATRGFGLAEMMIVLAIIVALSALLVPKAVSARLSANEHGAMQRLRAIHRAQVTVQIQRLVDEGGSYATLSELTKDLPQPIVASTLIPNADGIAAVGGYRFQLFLPDLTGQGMSEDPANRHPTLGAVYWCAYAWPDRAGATGRRAFVIDANGQILHTRNKN